MNRKLSLLLVSLLVVVTIIVCVHPAIGQTAPPGSETEKRVTVHFKDVPIQNAIEVLFQGSGYSYGLEPGIQGAITLSLNDVSFTDAMSALLKTAGLTVRKENGVYMISIQKELTAEMAPQLVPEIEVEIERETGFEKIPVGFTAVRELVDTLNGNPPDYSSNMGGMGGMGNTGGMGGMGGGMGNMGGMGGMGGGMGNYGGGMGGMGGGMGNYGGGMGGMGGGMGGMGGGMPRW